MPPTVIISLALTGVVPSVITYGNDTLVVVPSAVNVITPVGDTFTVPPVTAITCAVPGVNGVPLIDTIVNGLFSGSVSNANGVNVTVPTLETV